MKKYYLTTPIYYVNARPHLGHTYSTIIADVIRRVRRMQGYEAYYLTGTDEHGIKVQRSAQAAGVEPTEFTTRIANIYRALWDELGLNPDFFIRTTDKRHAVAVGELFRRAKGNGFIYKGEYRGAYCVYDELYVTDVKPGEPCTDCGRPTEEVAGENYFFKLSAFEDRLLNLYQKQPDFVRPEARRNEVISFVRAGLRDLSISRTTIQWGIPVPGDEKHVFYVWWDALIAYMSGIGFAQGGKEEEQWNKLWPADLHLVGKEILRFHTIYWPAFLMAANVPLPKSVYAHGLLMFQDEKMSKTRGNVVRAEPIHRIVGADGMRYFLLREIVFGQDGAFSYDALVDRYNSDLADGVGNLAKRTLDMISRYFNGEVPYPSAAERNEGDRAVQERAESVIEAAAASYGDFEFAKALATIQTLVASVNKYIVDNEPWALADKPEQRPRLATVLYTAAEAVRIVAVLLAPVMPAAASRIWRQLDQKGDVAEQQLGDLKWGQLGHGAKLTKVEAVFPKLDRDKTVAQLREMEDELKKEDAKPAPPPKPVAAPAPATEKISIDDFAKVEMRVGQVQTAERVKGADKLLKLTVDIGTEVRQIMAGIAEAYAPETLIGRKVVIVANLAPRKLRGVESNGMIVAATVGETGKPVLVSVPDDVPNGSRLK